MKAKTPKVVIFRVISPCLSLSKVSVSLIVSTVTMHELRVSAIVSLNTATGVRDDTCSSSTSKPATTTFNGVRTS